MAKNSNKTKGSTKSERLKVETPNGKAGADAVVARATARGGGNSDTTGQDAAARRADARFWQIAMVLIVLGIVLRQWALGAFPFMPDEAEHAWFAEGFSTYTYNPVYHGPLLYHLIALMFTLLGRSDYSARLAPSLLGIGMLGVVVGPARRWLGSNGTLWTLAILSLSPVMVTYQRRLIHESLFLLLTLGAALCFLRALETSSCTDAGRNARLGVAALAALLLTTKANSTFVIVMLIGFWIGNLLIRYCKKPITEILPRLFLVLAVIVSIGSAAMMARGADPAFFVILTVGFWGIWLLARQSDKPFIRNLPLPLFAIAAGASVVGLRDPDLVNHLTLLQQRWQDAGRDSNDMAFHSFIKFVSLLRSEHTYYAICFLLCVVFWLWLLLNQNLSPLEEAPVPVDDLGEPLPRIWDFGTPLMGVIVSLFFFTLLYGMWWRVPVYIVGDAYAQAAHHVLDQQHDLAVTARQSWELSKSALPDMWKYWYGQQGKPRLPGPHDYYVVLMLLYEMPIAIVSILAIRKATRERSLFTDLLLWWAFTSFVIYAIANEKVPWLLTHIMLPLILLVGWYLGQLKLEGWKLPATWAALIAGAIFLGRGTFATNFQRGADNHEPMFYAQTSDAYCDALFEGLRATAKLPMPLYVDNDSQWPTVWYIRANSPQLCGATERYVVNAQPGIRMAVCPPEKWEAVSAKFPRWKVVKTEFFQWQRASWGSLNPPWYWGWWWDRGTTRQEEDGLAKEDNFLSEPSHSYVDIAWPEE